VNTHTGDIGVDRLIHALGDACLIVDPQGGILSANTLAEDLYCCCFSGQLTGTSIADLAHAEDRETVMSELAICNGRARNFRAMQTRLDGGSFIGEFSAKACHDPGSEHVVLIIREACESNQPLKQDLTLRTLMLNHVGDGIVCHTVRGDLLFANRAAMRAWGVKDLEAARAMGAFGWVMGEARKSVSETIANIATDREVKFESHGVAPSGRTMHLETHSTVIETPEGDIVVSAIRDISDRVQAEEMVRYLAYHDTLTGLANRTLLESDLMQAVSDSERLDDLVGVVFLDLNDFKPVNDTYGHSVGDQVLREVADRIAGCVRESDTVARPGGDEFVVLLPRLARREHLPQIARKLAEAIAEPIDVEGTVIRVNASVGLAVHRAGEPAEAMITRADLAMYDARLIGEDGWDIFSAAD